jgi:putative nucleotidyltransferase with HDIG domain
MTAHEVVAKARNLPKISEAALKLVELLDESEDNNREAVELIKSDALLTAKLLRICNSSAFGLSEPVSSVNQAVLLLGYNQVLSLVLSLGFGSAMTGTLPGYALADNGLWHHSFMAATAAEAVVNRGLYSRVDASVAFTAGLLHDIGKLVMAQVLPAGAHAAIHKHILGEGLHGIAAEREVLGTDHAEVGACLLHVWRLPEWIVEAVANHHQPVLEPGPQLSALACLANRIALLAAVEPGTAISLSEQDQRVLPAFKLDAEGLDDLVSANRESAKQAGELLAMV